MKTKLCALAVALLIAFALKQHYANARANDLWWILAPTAKVVGVISGVPFTLQPGEGYFSRERLFLIEKSCAGINFMIAAFAMLVFTFLHRVGSAKSAARVVSVSFVASYTAAVTVNAVRIAIALWLAAHRAALPSLSPDDIHRIEGIVVYFSGLVLLYEIATRLSIRAETTR
jgi:exosortase K